MATTLITYEEVEAQVGTLPSCHPRPDSTNIRQLVKILSKRAALYETINALSEEKGELSKHGTTVCDHDDVATTSCTTCTTNGSTRSICNTNPPSTPDSTICAGPTTRTRVCTTKGAPARLSSKKHKQRTRKRKDQRRPWKRKQQNGIWPATTNGRRGPTEFSIL